MSAIRAATVLALWGAAYARGLVAPDDVISAVSDTGHTAGVRAADEETAAALDLPGPGSAGSGSLALLELLRAGDGGQLLLPVAGDVRGVPPGHRALLTALEAGAALRLRRPAGPGSLVVPVDGHWRVFVVAPEAAGTGAPLPWTVHEAERTIDRAILTATARLRALDVARESAAVRDRIAEAMRRAAHDNPRSMDRSASSLLAKVISLQALLDTAAGHRTAAVSRFELGAVDDALRPLTEAVRQGRLAAVAGAFGPGRNTADPTAGRHGGSPEQSTVTRGAY